MTNASIQVLVIWRVRSESASAFLTFGHLNCPFERFRLMPGIRINIEKPFAFGLLRKLVTGPGFAQPAGRKFFAPNDF